MKGSQLAEYAQKINERVAVAKCLSTSVTDLDLKIAAVKEEVCNSKLEPDVAWWGDLNHGGRITLAQSRYKGNWQSFIKF